MLSSGVDRRALLAWLATLSGCGGGGGSAQVAEPEPAPVVVQTVAFFDAQRGWGTGTAAGKKAILTTTDGGASWRAHVSGITDDVVITPIDALRAWAVSRTERVYRTQDGGASWLEYTADSSPHDFAQVVSPPDALRIMIRYPQVHGFNVVRMRASTDGGISWYSTTFENAFQNAVTRSGVVLQLASADQGLRRALQVSTDFGKTSREVALQATALGALEDGSLWAQVVHPPEGTGDSNASLLALAKSLDDGRSWSQVDMSIPPIVKASDLGNFSVRSLSVSGTGWAWVGLGNGPAVFFRTTDQGRTWQLAPLPAGVGFEQVSSEFLDSTSCLLKANTGNAAWLSVDGGDHWTALQIAAEAERPKTVERDGGRGLLASFYSSSTADIRWYRSTDQGAHWARL